MKKVMSLLLMSLIGLVGTSRGQVRPRKTRSTACNRLSMFCTASWRLRQRHPEQVLNDAKCVVVVPNLVKGASSLAPSTDVASPPAARLLAGALRIHHIGAEAGIADRRRRRGSRHARHNDRGCSICSPASSSLAVKDGCSRTGRPFSGAGTDWN